MSAISSLLPKKNRRYETRWLLPALFLLPVRFKESDQLGPRRTQEAHHLRGGGAPEAEQPGPQLGQAGHGGEGPPPPPAQYLAAGDEPPPHPEGPKHLGEVAPHPVQDPLGAAPASPPP